MEKVKIIISDCDLFRGLCPGDAAVVVGAGFAVFFGAAVVVAAGVAAGKAAAVAMGAGASRSCAAIAVGAASRANINSFILQHGCGAPPLEMRSSHVEGTRLIQSHPHC